VVEEPLGSAAILARAPMNVDEATGAFALRR